jgi:O-antigen ligase
LKKNNTAISYRNKSNLFVYLTCLFIITWYLQLGSRIGLLGAIRFEFILGAFLSICAFLNYPSGSSPLRGPVVLFFGVLSLYTCFSYDFLFSWDIFFNRVVKFSMLALFFSVFIRTPWALKMAIGAFLLAMMKLNLEGFIGWVTGSMVWENQGILRLHGSVPIYMHPNSFSGMAVGCLPFVYYLYPTVSRVWKWFLLALFLFCSVVIIFTGSRTGYVATAGLGVVFFLKSQGKDRWRYLLLAVLVCIGVVILAPKAYVERFDSIFTQQDKEGASTATRIEIIKDAAKIYLSNPLGVGVGAFPLVRKQMFGRTQDTHNMYLELLTNLGPLGLIAFFVLIRRIFTVNIEVQKRIDSIEFDDKAILLAISKAIVAFVYARLFLGLFGMDTYEIYWWFAAGVTISLWACVRYIYGKEISSVA